MAVGTRQSTDARLGLNQATNGIVHAVETHTRDREALAKAITALPQMARGTTGHQIFIELLATRARTNKGTFKIWETALVFRHSIMVPTGKGKEIEYVDFEPQLKELALLGLLHYKPDAESTKITITDLGIVTGDLLAGGILEPIGRECMR